MPETDPLSKSASTAAVPPTGPVATGPIVDVASARATWARLNAEVFARKHGPAAVVSVVGADAAKFVQRLSTAETKDVGDTRATLNVFTDKKGKIRHVVTQWRVFDSVFLLDDGADATGLAAWLDSFHFAESLKISTVDKPAVHLVGKTLDARLKEILGVGPMRPFDVVTHAGCTVIGHIPVVGLDGGFLPSALVIDPPASLMGFPSVDEPMRHVLDIATGIPRAPFEISDAVNPLEVGLKSFVSFDKGCFTGQEVIARTENLDKLSKHLVGLKSAVALQADDQVIVDGAVIGVVTRGVTPVDDAHISALAILRTKVPPYGSVVEIHRQNDVWKAEVVRRPIENELLTMSATDARF